MKSEVDLIKNGMSRARITKLFTGRLVYVIETKGNVRQGNDSYASQILLPPPHHAFNS
jgi:hypothetical protein